MTLPLPATAEPSLDQELWDREYRSLQVIPSSTRMSPSKALLLYSELLAFDRLQRVLDAGCGTGRNSIYLARKGCEVHAVDFSKAALEVLAREAEKAGVADGIFSYHQSLGDRFAFAGETFDLVVDSYVFTHFVTPAFQRTYRDELHRVIRRGGFVFSSVFSIEDQYYREALEHEANGPTVVTDPRNGITKCLYTEESIRAFFAGCFHVLYLTKFEFDDVVQGASYRRSVIALALRRDG